MDIKSSEIVSPVNEPVHRMLLCCTRSGHESRSSSLCQSGKCSASSSAGGSIGKVIRFSLGWQGWQFIERASVVSRSETKQEGRGLGSIVEQGGYAGPHQSAGYHDDENH